MLDFYKGKKVFVTGCTGFKGSWLCAILAKAGANISGFALPPGNPALWKESGVGERVHLYTGDIRDRAGLTTAMRETAPEIVFHLAAQPLVRRSYRESALTYETNVLGTVNILEALKATPSVRSFVNVTTDKVYENREWIWGYRENENLCGLDPYSNSKSCSDLVTASYRVSFFQNVDSPAVSTARAGNVIGGGDYSEDRIIPDCVRAALANKPVILRHPSSVRSYQHALDCLSGYLLLAARQYDDKSLAGAYNFGADENGCVTTGKLAGLFCDAWGTGASWKVSDKDSAASPHEVNFVRLDSSKARVSLGWFSKWSIKTTIDKVVEYAKAKTDGERRDCVTGQIEDYFEK
jgi:CDP-glucose 4,6-dehydratase